MWQSVAQLTTDRSRKRTREILTRDQTAVETDKGGGMIPRLLLMSRMMNNCKDNNGNDEDDISDSKHWVGDIRIVGTGAGEGKNPTHNLGSDGRISEGG